MSDAAAGPLLVVGSLVFLTGAAVGVPRVFTERDPNARVRLLSSGLGRWRVAQPLYALGPLVASGGAGVLASAASGRQEALFGFSAAALFVGALPWAWFAYLRGTRVEAFAFGRLPRWPFPTYVLLTIAGTALLGAALLAGDFPAWMGWLTAAAAGVFLAGYLVGGDLPPFVFYLLFLALGAEML